MVLGKGKFTRVNFDEKSLEFKFKFFKIGTVNKNVLSDIKKYTLQWFAGLKDITLERNENEITITYYLTKQLTKEQIEHFVDGKKPKQLTLNLDSQTEFINRICKMYI